MLKERKGITIIALIITIIVLLILAGVTIITLTGENGILTKATRAKEDTAKAELIEKAKVDIIEQQSNANGDISKEQIQKVLQKYFSNIPEELPDSIVGIELIAKDEYGGYKIMGEEIYTGDLSEKIEPGATLAEKITVDNYGDYINYSVDLKIDGDQDGDTTDVDDWRIFYKDETGNVFIISADYVPNTNTILDNAVNQIGVIDIGNTYGIRWWLKRTYNEIDTNITNLFKFGFDYSKSTLNNNIILTSKLLDANIWSGFASGVEGATAIAGPTLEIYMASWNAKGYTKLNYDNSKEVGYYIGTSNSPTGTHVSIKSDTKGYNDTLYYPHKSKYDNSCFGYWLVSPSAEVSTSTNIIGEYQYGVDCTGEITDCTLTADYYAVRPLVCLPAGTQGNQDNKGIWQIQ